MVSHEWVDRTVRSLDGLPTSHEGATVKEVGSRLVLAVCVLLGSGLFNADGTVLADSAKVKSTTNLASTLYTTVVAQGAPGGSASISTTRSVSHSRSGSVGVSWSILNASAGFTITETLSVTYSYSRSAPDRRYCYKVTASDRWKRYVIEWHHVGWGPLPNSNGTLTVKRHNGIAYNAPTPTRVPSSGRCN